MGHHISKLQQSHDTKSNPFNACKRNLTDIDGDNAITSLGLIHLEGASWNNLTVLALSQNQITNIGCKFIVRASMPLLFNLSLSGNYICTEGLLHLSKGVWKNFIELGLSQNHITSIYWSLKGNWPKILSIFCCRIEYYQAKNDIKEPEMIHVVLHQFRKIKNFYLSYNMNSQKRAFQVIRQNSYLNTNMTGNN